MAAGPSPAAGEIERCDVLVVGLGPAGASAAAAAARGGTRVLAIDRKREPGLPVQCAEFVPALTGQQVEGLDRHRTQLISAMTTLVEGRPPHVEASFRGVMIDRAKFDADLVDEARRAGASIRMGTLLRDIDAGGVVSLSDGRCLAPSVIVGADGPHSAVGRAIGIVNRVLADTRQITVPLLEPFADTDIFLSTRLPGGYAWLFPRGTVANLGLGADPRWRAEFKPLLDALHAELCAQGRVGPQTLAITGGAIPSGGLLEPVATIGTATVLLAGDAAGLTNPVTGAGIHSALVSGRMAGEAAAGILQGHRRAADDYGIDLADLFEVSLRRAVDRRQALLALYEQGLKPSVGDLERAWIAFPSYWAA